MPSITIIEGRAMPLVEAAINTDTLFPARFLLLIERAGMGHYLLYDRRYDADGHERPGFVLNDPRYRGASILLAGASFGTGSSREQAVWALADHGFRAVVAPSFGDIFAANCAGNGIVAAEVRADQVAALALVDGPLVIDLVARTIRADAIEIAFAIDPRHRETLMSGRDRIARILEDEAGAVVRYDRERAASTPWLVPDWKELA